jgi:hypothetical protein
MRFRESTPPPYNGSSPTALVYEVRGMAIIGFPPSATGELRFPELRPDEIIRVSERILDDLGWHITLVDDEGIEVRTGTGIWFFGDRMTVDVSRGGVVTVHSRCIWPTQIIDFGRNDRNVERFLDRLERKLARLVRRQEQSDDDR